jgi:hypothetical protein
VARQVLEHRPGLGDPPRLRKQIPMHESIELARGAVAPDSVITIHLIRHPGRQELILLRWPGRPTQIEPSKLPP